jgi:hypothetical protein
MSRSGALKQPVKTSGLGGGHIVAIGLGVAFMTDDYPPFHFDGGPTEPRGPQPQLPRPDASTRATAPDERHPNLVGT